MNQKKCPKCGEDNPPEAVMCWACYTPLSGGAAAGATGAAAPGKGAPAMDAGEGKEKPPAWQLGIIGVGFLGALFIGANSMGLFGGGGGAEEEAPLVEPIVEGEQPANVDPAAPPPEPVAPPAPPDGGGAPALPAAPEAPFTVVTTPNPKVSTGVMAIMPKTQTISAESAARLAAFTYRQVAQPGRWPVFQIFVFNNDKAAEIFREYQKKRRGAPLTENDYRRLSRVWQNAYVRYEFRKAGNKGVETVRYPYKNPSGWWLRQSGN